MHSELYIVRMIEMDYELLFPIGYREDFRELMEYIDSQFALIENENSQAFISYLDDWWMI